MTAFLDHKTKKYIGPLSPGDKRLPHTLRRGLWIYYGQRARSGTTYSSREFVYWWVTNKERKKIKPTNHAHVGRLDHRKPYSFDNIKIQTITENDRERNARCGNPGRTHRQVMAITKSGNIVFKSKTEAAKFFGIDPKTIWNRCEKITTKTHNGPKNSAREVEFIWLKK